MFKQKRKKFTTTVTLEKTCPEKTLVQLTEDQLKAIAGGSGGCGSDCTRNHNETMVSAAQLNLEGDTDGAH